MMAIKIIDLGECKPILTNCMTKNILKTHILLLTSNTGHCSSSDGPPCAQHAQTSWAPLCK